MAIRVAVGATRASITALILKRGPGAHVRRLRPSGALGFIAVGRAIESQLYEVAPSDPANAAVVMAILFASAICACLRPAWNALRQAPITVLREM
jgi:hypothetical protein